MGGFHTPGPISLMGCEEAGQLPRDPVHTIGSELWDTTPRSCMNWTGAVFVGIPCSLPPLVIMVARNGLIKLTLIDRVLRVD